MTNKQTVLLTGATGYIAKHIALKLLDAGYHVVGSLRDLSRAQEVINAVSPHLASSENLEKRLRFVKLDLASDTGWAKSMEGVDILMHTASPFPFTQPKSDDDVIKPAVNGTLRALKAARDAGVKRVVLTSSFAAIMDTDLPPGKSEYDETMWSETDRPSVAAYSKSKTLAERAAWEFVNSQASDMALTVINPVMVLGAPLDNKFGTSVAVVQRLLQAKDPMLPRFGFAIVDVRDVAEMHLRALSCPESIGQRILAVHSFAWFVEFAQQLKTQFPSRKIVTRQAPNVVVRFLGLFDPAIRQITPRLGERISPSNNLAKRLLGMEFIPASISLKESADFLIDNDLVD